MIAPAAQQTIDAVLAGNVRSGARLITQAESGAANVRPILQELYRHGGHAQVIGVTGPPGAGKSTLVDQLVSHYRNLGKRVAILAVDPSSPFSGGAVLGDRLRMGRHDTDPGVFIRSMATRGALGGLSKAVGDALIILDAMRWNVVIVETVGVGQNEMDIVRHASCVVLLQTATSGDVIQMAKAGVLEIGDIFVVNKSDIQGSDRIVNALNEMIGNRSDHGATDAWQPMALQTEATSGKGVADLADQIGHRFAFLSDHPAAAREHQASRVRARALQIANQIFTERLHHQLRFDATQQQLLTEVLERKRDPYELAEALLAAKI